MNLLTVGIIVSTLGSMFFYWAAAKNRWMKQAYCVSVVNGAVLIWVNWVLSGPGKVPELTLQGIEWSSHTGSTNIFNILCIWIIISGFRGLARLRAK